MIVLFNGELRVDLIDPAVDQSRLGPRYCWGGYIWQVADPLAGPLLAGPEWPVAEPLPHHGQGLPESFRHSTTTGAPLLWNGATGLAPGAGALGRDSNGAVVVTQPCEWEIEATASRAIFRTTQSVGGWSYSIERIVELSGRTLISTSRLVNHGDDRLKLEWFAHPFFALRHDGLLTVTLPEGTSIPENHGFELEGRTLSIRRAFEGLHGGHLEQLSLPDGSELVAQLSHPRIKGVRFSTSFAPFKTVLWANGNTLSLEPFLAIDLAPGESREWSLTYEFGVSP